MAGGPFFPNSAYPGSANAFPNFHVGAGANSKWDEGLGVAASIAADTIWHLRFQMPTTLPTGTATFRLIALANATSGAARVNPKWVSVAVGESPSAATPIAETVTPTSRAGNAGGAGDTLVWGTGDADQYLELRWTMDADTVTAGEIIVMALTFETASWTLAAVSTWIPSILFV